MNPYLLQMAAAEHGKSMRTAAAAARLARQARRTGQARPHQAGHLLRLIPRQRVPQEPVARRAA